MFIVMYIIWLMLMLFGAWVSEVKKEEIGTLLFLLSLPAALYAPMLVIQRAAAVFVRITYEKILAITKIFDYN